MFENCGQLPLIFLESNWRNEEYRRLQLWNSLCGTTWSHFPRIPQIVCKYLLIKVKLKKEDETNLAILHKGCSSTYFNKRITDIITKISIKTDLSPKGMIALLMFISNLSSVKIPSDFKDANFLKNLANLIVESQVSVISEWPINFGGG